MKITDTIVAVRVLHGLNKIGFTSKPSHRNVLKWFRDKHSLCPSIIRDGGWWLVEIMDYSEEEEHTPTLTPVKFIRSEDTYEEAEFNAIKEMIKIIIKK